MLQQGKQGVLAFLLLIGGVNFCLFMEEPIFDLSDWNACHIVLLVLTLVGVFGELRTRAAVGQ
jgi:hypothetical protein